MLYEIFKFEIKYRARRADTYLYFVILFLFSIIAVEFLADGNLEPLKRNSPYVIARTMGIVSALFMVLTSMIMGVSVLRDFDHKMESLVFINPIKKHEYLLGRFLGSFVVLVFIYCGLLLGMVVGDLIPWHEEGVLLPFNLWHYLQPFLFLILPTLFFGGAIFFVSGALSRKLIIVYIQGFLFLMVYLLSMSLAIGADDLFLTGLLEPFTFQSVRIATQFWTVVERKTQMIPMEGVLMYNRLLWLAIGGIALVIGYYGFSFNVVRGRRKQLKTTSEKKKNTTTSYGNIKIPLVRQHTGLGASLNQLFQHAFFNFKSIVKSLPFLAIVICGMGIMVISSFNLGTTHGVDSYPTTYILVGEFVEMTVIFFLSIVVFYSGELVWQERDAKVSGVYDALPMSDFVSLTGKFIGLMLTLVVLLLSLIVASIAFQTMKGYYQYEVDVYFTGFFLEVLPFLFLLAVTCFFFQALINHKFLAHLVTLIFVFSTSIMLQLFGVDHDLYTFGGSDLGTYSDMNGYGHFLVPYFWFKTYWIAVATILFIVATLLSVRGTEVQFKNRLKLVKQRLTTPILRLGVGALLVFIFSGCYIYYNTNVLNDYFLPAQQEEHRAAYEKTLKKFEFDPQPVIVDVNLTMELYPSERDYTTEGHYVLTNKHDRIIEDVHIQKLPNAQVALEYLTFERGADLDDTYVNPYSYYIYKLDEPLLPGDSIKMEFKQTFNTNGFAESAGTHVVYNGTFIDNFHFPTIGYNEDIELEDDGIRKEHGLEPKVRRANINDPIALRQGRADGDGEEINFEMIVGTDSSQTAIAPGYLQGVWEKDGRKYFHYKMDKPMSNFYSIVSARYEVKRDHWVPAHDSLGSAVNLEIYYHKGHEYNLDRMMDGMKKSLDYFSQNFGAYQYRQLRICESPIYQVKAQSFPNTIPFSEGIGFIMDIDDEQDVDMAFYVTAHEVAHQWWGHQVNPANVQGQSMLSEALAQYSALMVLKQHHPESKVQQLVKQQMQRYFKGRSRERVKEMSLALVESGQEYIHYGKGLINLYAFQDYISEDSVNKALTRFIRDWDSFQGLKKTQTDRYATSKDLLGYFREVTPDSLQYTIEDLFETITVYDNRATIMSYKKLPDGQYKVSLTLETLKYKMDSLGVEKLVKMNDWIDIGVYAEGKNGSGELVYLKKHKVTDSLTNLEIIMDQKPVKAGIDPLNKLIDKDLKNNLIGVSEEEPEV